MVFSFATPATRRVWRGSERTAAPAVAPLPLCRALRRVFAGTMLSLLWPGHGAQANPQIPTVVNGQATFQAAGKRLTVTNSAGAAIDWRSFSIQPGESTHFQQSGASSTVLNRVTSALPSQILGTLTSNGKVVLVNPAGIAFGNSAVVDTAGFTASTLWISLPDWIAGRMRLTGDASAGAVQVDGTLRAQGGDIVLIAPQVDVGRAAVVQAVDGSVLLAAGHSAELTGRGLEGLRFEIRAGGEARNLGRLAGDAVGVFAGTLRHSGQIVARTALQEGGRVVLLASDITITDQGRIDASGRTQGGTVLVGGGAKGAAALDGMANARDVHLAAGSVVSADALEQGNGGQLVLWADKSLAAHGDLSARGGPAGGNGGHVETSARKSLLVTRAPDLRAAAGRGGSWLLDPDDVDIDDDDTLNFDGTNFRPFNPGNSRIQAFLLQRALNNGISVTIDTTNDNGHGNGNGGSGNIRISKPIIKTAGTALHPDATLTLNAENDILLNAFIGSSFGKLNLVLNPDSDRNGDGRSFLNADVHTNGGTITMLGPRPLVWAPNTEIRNSTLNVPAGGRLEMPGPGTHTLNHSVLNNAGTTMFASDMLLVNNGSTLNNSNRFELAGNGTITENADCGPCAIDNTGTIIKTLGTGTSEIGGPQLVYTGNNEVLDAGAGTIRFGSTNAGHSHSGALSLAGNVLFAAGGHSFTGATSLSGRLNLVGANATFGTLTLAEQTRYTGGTLSILDGQTLTLPTEASFAWGSGTRISGGTFRVNKGAELDATSTGVHELWGTTLDNRGLFHLGSGSLLVNNRSLLRNAGALMLRGDAAITENSSCDPCRFENSGSIVRLGGSGVNDIAGAQLVYAGTNETLDAGSGTIRFGSTQAGHSHTGSTTLLGNVEFASGGHSFVGSTGISGTLNLLGANASFGTLTLPAQTNYLGGALTITGGSTLTVPATGKLTWGSGTSVSGGTLQIASGAELDLTGTGNHQLSGTTLANQGTLHLRSASLLVNKRSTLSNSGTIELLGEGSITENNGCDPCRFDNAGTIVKLAGTGTNDIGGAQLVYAGTNEVLDAGAGTIRFSSGSAGHTHTGFSDLVGNILFASGGHSFVGSTAIRGTFNLAGADALFGNLTLPARTHYSAGSLTIADGTMLTVPDGGHFNWSAGTTITGGALAVSFGAQLDLQGSGTHQLSGTSLGNHGTVQFRSAALLLNDGATLANHGRLELFGDGAISANSGCEFLCGLYNAGTIVKLAGTGNTDIGGTQLVYSGDGETVDAGTGSIRFTSADRRNTHQGLVTLRGNVLFTAGQHGFADGSVIDGSLRLAGADSRFENAALGEETSLSAGTLTVGQGKTLSLAGGSVFNWGGDTRMQGGTFEVASGATVNVDGAGSHELRTMGFNNAGRVNYRTGTGGSLRLDNGASFRNLPSGVLDFATGGEVTGMPACEPCTFRNDGTISVNAAGATVAWNGFGTNYVLGGTSGLLLHSGTLAVEGNLANPGTIALDAGTTLALRAAELINTGSLRGTGTVAASLVRNDGTVNPGTDDAPGTLTVSGNYTQGSTGQLQVRVLDATQFGKLRVTGHATLAGTALVDGGDALPSTTTLQVLLADGAVQGTLAAQPSANWKAEFASSAVRLVPRTQDATTPPPTASPPATQVDRIVALLNGEASASEVQKSVAELDATLASTDKLLSDAEKKKGERSESGDTGVQCK